MLWMGYMLAALAVSTAIMGRIVSWNKNRGKGYSRRLGGLGIILAFVLVILFIPELVMTSQIKAFVLGSGMILFFGLWDDMVDLSWKVQLAFQFLLGGILVFFNYRIDYIPHPFGGMVRLDGWFIPGTNWPLLGFLLVLLWLVAIMNAVNWADGIDGLSGGIGILAALAVFLASLRPEVNQPAVAILCLVMIGALLGFWWFNFPPGQIEAGSSGSYFIGFSLAILAVIAGTKIATALVVLILPLIDAAWVAKERIKEGQSIFIKDYGARHLHYRLRQIGWSDRKILLTYLAFLGLMLAFSLLADVRWQKMLLLAVESGILVVAMLFLQKWEKNLKNNKVNENADTR